MTPQALLALEAHDLWIFVTAAACLAACAPLGCLLVLRRQSLLSDSISHSVLPGIAMAFLLSGSRNPVFMVAGALAAGLLSAFFSSFLERFCRVQGDAALGIAFTTMFSLGVILISIAARQVDLDPGCVLYGALELVPFDTITDSSPVPRLFVILSAVALCNLLFVVLFSKELKLLAFDPEGSRVFGVRMTLLHVATLILVTSTTVLSFEAGGSILVVSFLIAPGAAAFLLARSFGSMMVYSYILGCFSCVLGYAAALTFNTTASGSISAAAGVLFLLMCVVAPRKGLGVRYLRHIGLRFRILRDDILGFLFRWYEFHPSSVEFPAAPTSRDIAVALNAPFLSRLALASLIRKGEVLRASTGELRLSEGGSKEAISLVRSHRLWEAYLAKELKLPLDHLHAPAARTEHFIAEEITKSLESEVGAEEDPHGRGIPRS